jgi:AcrR family transcriptional regulator
MLELYQNRMKSQKNDHGLGVSVEELAEYCSVNRTTVLRYLHGRQRGSTRIGHLLKIVQPVRPGRGRKKLYHPNEALDGLARFLLMQNKVVAIIRDTYAELLECRLQDYHLLCQRYRQAQANVRVYQGGGHLKDLEDTVYELRNRRYEHLPSDFRRRLRADDEIVCRIAHYLEETYPEFTRIEEHTMSTIHDPRRWLEGVLIRFHEAVKVWTRVLQGLEEAQADLGMKTRSSKDPMTEFLSPVLFGFPEHIRLALNSLYSEISEWGFYREINLLPKQDLSLIYGHIEREYRAGRISRTTRDERRCLLATAWRQHLKSLARTQTVLSQIFH